MSDPVEPGVEICDACGREDRLAEVTVDDGDTETTEMWCPACMALQMAEEASDAI